MTEITQEDLENLNRVYWWVVKLCEEYPDREDIEECQESLSGVYFFLDEYLNPGEGKATMPVLEEGSFDFDEDGCITRDEL